MFLYDIAVTRPGFHPETTPIPPSVACDPDLVATLVACTAAVLREDLVPPAAPGGHRDPLHRHRLTSVMEPSLLFLTKEREAAFVEAWSPPEAPRNVYMFLTSNRFALFPHTPAGRVFWRLFELFGAWGESLSSVHGIEHCQVIFKTLQTKIQRQAESLQSKVDPVLKTWQRGSSVRFIGDAATWLAMMLVLRLFRPAVAAADLMATILASAPGVEASRNSSMLTSMRQTIHYTYKTEELQFIQQAVVPALLWEAVPDPLKLSGEKAEVLGPNILKLLASVMDQFRGIPHSTPRTKKELQAGASQLLRCSQFLLWLPPSVMAITLEMPEAVVLQYMFPVDRYVDPKYCPRPLSQVQAAQDFFHLFIATFTKSKSFQDLLSLFLQDPKLKPIQDQWTEQLNYMMLDLLMVAPRALLLRQTQLAALAWAVYTYPLGGDETRGRQLFELYYFRYNTVFALRGADCLRLWVPVEDAIMQKVPRYGNIHVALKEIQRFHTVANRVCRPSTLVTLQRRRLGTPGPDFEALLLKNHGGLSFFTPLFSLVELCLGTLNPVTLSAWKRTLQAWWLRATEAWEREVLKPCLMELDTQSRVADIPVLDGTVQVPRGNSPKRSTPPDETGPSKRQRVTSSIQATEGLEVSTMVTAPEALQAPPAMEYFLCGTRPK